jgi:hypothetical protein
MITPLLNSLIMSVEHIIMTTTNIEILVRRLTTVRMLQKTVLEPSNLKMTQLMTVAVVESQINR